MSRATVLVVDDEDLIRWSIVEQLEGDGHATIEAVDGEDALLKLAEVEPDLMLLDLTMPKLDGMGVLARLREAGNRTPVVVVTANGDLNTAIDATRLGAVGYLTKPFDLRELGLEVERILTEAQIRREVVRLRANEASRFGAFIGAAPTLDPVFKTLERIADIPTPTVLITGESGTGKEVLARTVHNRSTRAAGPFVAVDCAALPETLVESELFGHERGAFTDAKRTKQGLFEAASGGTLMLDEVGELPLAMQARLLRTLETRSFRRVGGTRQIPMDCALLAATNRDLRAEVDAGRFREDLYYRLAVIPVRLPALRERAEDIPTLVSHFVKQFSERYGRRVSGITREALQLMSDFRWRGNIRELRNVVERMVILADAEQLGVEHLPTEVRYAVRGTTGDEKCPFTLPEDGVDLEAVERGLIVQALERTGQNQSAAARLLRMSRYALRYRVDKYNL